MLLVSVDRNEVQIVSVAGDLKELAVHELARPTPRRFERKTVIFPATTDSNRETGPSLTSR